MAASVALWRAISWCRLGAVCRPRDRNVPLLAAVLRSRERIYWIFLGFGFFFEPEGRGFESLPACQVSSTRSVSSPETIRSSA
jgi:hypothetical protein